ncbi:MAG TPA: hypothetical protein VF139_12650 [Candidatus Polarisedimenticolaceae bacterium]
MGRGEARGDLVDRVTQRWVRWTGRRVRLEDHPWLDGPVGKPEGIGSSFFDAYVAERGLRALRGEPGGLLADLQALRSASFDPARVDPAVVEFYTRTSDYALDTWSEWTGVFRPFGWMLARIFSRRLQQLNVPLSNLDTSRGMTSEVIVVAEPHGGRRLFAAWVRTLVRTGDVIYAGAYSTCVVPEGSTPCVRVVFPLPNGNGIVLMRAVVEDDGSLRLISAGNGFGSPGFYFTVRDRNGAIRSRYVRALRETIHVYPSGSDVRADHVLKLWGMTFLRLHYRLTPRAAAGRSEGL